MSENAPAKPLYRTILESSVIATCLAGLLSTVVGGYLLNIAKENALEVEREREKQAALINNQLEVLETLNSVLAEYKLAAEFVIFDIVDRRGETLEDQQSILRSIAAFDRASQEFLNSAYRGVFRTRIYFADPKLCEELEKHLTRLNTPGNMIAIDGALSVQITEYKRRMQEQEEAEAKPGVIKNISIRITEDVESLDNQDLELALRSTRQALRAEFEAVTDILESLADTTVAKR